MIFHSKGEGLLLLLFGRTYIKAVHQEGLAKNCSQADINWLNKYLLTLIGECITDAKKSITFTSVAQHWLL